MRAQVYASAGLPGSSGRGYRKAPLQFSGVLARRAFSDPTNQPESVGLGSVRKSFTVGINPSPTEDLKLRGPRRGLALDCDLADAACVIELQDVGKRYGEDWVVRDVTMTVARGELVAVLGESGSGKTTLLRMINRLVDPDAGLVKIDGRDVRGEDPVALRRTIGYVIQNVGLLPHLSVAANVAMVPRLLGWPNEQTRARVDELLDLVGLAAATYRDRYPDQLSGGQRQRVGVARALAARPRVLLLDEPLGALDPLTRVALQDELRRIHKELALTSILVTHDMVEAMVLADRIAVMLRGELRQLATPDELVASPADEYVARLVAMARRQGEQLVGIGAAQ
jgi:osmoprotectant transport system ATP-binding protein